MGINPGATYLSYVSTKQIAQQYNTWPIHIDIARDLNGERIGKIG